MNKRTALMFSLTCMLFLFSKSAWSQDYACVETNVGDFCMQLYHGEAPDTVANFLKYLEEGSYDRTLIHRSVPEVIIQGGGYFYDPFIEHVPEDPPIENEFSLSNERGTVAMAKLGGDPDSATSQWFINLGDNVGLDITDGGYTVFAGIVRGMEVVDTIGNSIRKDFRNALQDAAFGEVPVHIEHPPGVAYEIGDFILVERIYATNTLPAITSFNGHSLTLPVRINGKLYEATLILTAQSPDLLFEVDKSQIAVLADSGQDAAVFDGATGLLTIPSVQTGAHRFNDVTLQLSNSATLEFTLQDFTRVDTQ